MSKLLLLFILLPILAVSQSRFTDSRMFTLTLDGSRLIEDTSEFDSGLDIVGTLILDRNSLLEPVLKVELFPNINYYKLAIGANYALNIDLNTLKTEALLGVEIGVLVRQRPGYESYMDFKSYAFNAEYRIFIFEYFPLIFQYNYQRRSDFQMYNTKPKFVGSTFVGLGYIF